MRSVRVGEGSGNSSLTFFRQDLGGLRRRGKTERHSPEPFARFTECRMKTVTQKSQTMATFPQSVTMEIRQAPTPSRNTWYLTGHLRHCSCNHIFMKMALNFKKWYCRPGSENCTPLLLRALGSWSPASQVLHLHFPSRKMKIISDGFYSNLGSLIHLLD